MGRPLSLIALDALYLCTTKDLTGQSSWTQKHRPTLTDRVEPEIIANRLREYQKMDGVPRVQKIVEMILHNLLETT